MRQLGGFALVCALVSSMAPRAEAQCSNSNIGSAQLNPSGGVATPPISDTAWNPAGGAYTYSFQGTKVYVVNNNNMAQKYTTVAMNDSPNTIQGFPIPVQLMNNGTKTSMFMSSSDGYVKRFDFDGVSLSQVCTANVQVNGVDTLTASPTVMINAYSINPAFKALGKDVVYVPTNLSGTSTGNQVVAINAADCSILWRFNLKGTYPMDYASEGCSLDYGDALTGPTLYCGTHLPILHPQGTLWAIDAVAGTLRWGVNADSITTRPELRSGRLYVATQAGSIRAHSTTNGSLFWAATIAGSLTKDVFVEQRLVGGMNSQLLVTDPNGIVHSLTDNGAGYGAAWTYTPSAYASGARVISAPTISNIDGKVYVGLNNGQLHQINLITGAFEHGVTAGASAADSVYDPTLDVSTKAAVGLDRLRVSTSNGGVSATNLKSFCIPWLVDGAQSGAEVPVPAPGWGPGPAPAKVPGGPHPAVACPGVAPTSPCVTYACDTTTGTWQPTIKANGTACSDGNAHTCDSPTCNSCPKLACFCGTTCPVGNNDHCQSGLCVSNETDSAVPWACSSQDKTTICGTDPYCACNYACGSVGDHGVCPDSKSCCGGEKCIDLQNDPLNCGSCGNDCAKKRFGNSTPEGVDQCVEGICVRSPGYYCSPQAPDESTLNGLASQLTGASNINFPTLSILGNTPCAIGISFAGRPNDGGCFFGGPGKNNGIALIDPTNNNTVQKFQPTSCNGFCLPTCPPPPYTTPFTGVALLWDFWTGNIQSNSDWVLVGTQANQTAGTSANPPLPGAFVVLDEKVGSGGDIFTDTLGGYSNESASPFFDAQYNQGVVGPAIADGQSPFDTNGMNMYYANWLGGWNVQADGYLAIVNMKCTGQGGNPPPSCTFTSSIAPNWPPAGWPGTRITTLSYSNYECRSGGGKCTANEPNPTKIFLTTGKQVWVYYPPYLQGSPANSGSLFADISNPALYSPDPTNPQEQPIVGFVSAAPDPLYGDLYLEARDVGGNLEDFVLYIPNTYTAVAYAPKAFYNLGDMAKSLNLKGRKNGTPITVPYQYTTTTPEGRLAAANANCIRMTVQQGQNPSFTNLPLWP